MPLCVGKRRTDWQIATLSPRTHRPAHHPIKDTREASQLSDPSPRSGAHRVSGNPISYQQR